MSEVYFSNVECACGCLNLLPEKWAHPPSGRKRRYLYGHSPAPKKDKAAPAANSTSAKKMVEFFDAELALQEKQLAAHEAQHRELSSKISGVREAIDTARAQIVSTKRLRGEIQAHFKQSN